MARWGLAGIFAVLFAGCGSTAGAPRETSEPPLEAPPPIQAVDEPAPDAWGTWFQLDFRLPPECADDEEACTEGQSACFWLSNREGEERSWSGECTAEDIKRLEEQFDAQMAAYEPASDSQPRIFARLPVEDRSHIDLITWRTKANKICILAEGPEPESLSGPNGECEPYGPKACPRLCLEPIHGDRLIFFGAVAAEADSIAIELRNGDVLRYPLVGPLVPGVEYRAFMADLGARSYRRIELLRGDRVVAEQSRAREELRWEDCVKKIGEDVTNETDSALEACIKEGAEEPSE